MISVDEIQAHCLKKEKTTQEFPFDESTLVYKVLGKIFALCPLEAWEQGSPSVTLKCDPDYAEELRHTHDAIQPVSNKNNNKVDDNKDGTIDYSFENPDFSYVQFNSNLVLRWEYIPGSELFLVWSQGVSGNVSTSKGLFEGFETGVLEQRPQNIFLVKATYRFIL